MLSMKWVRWTYALFVGSYLCIYLWTAELIVIVTESRLSIWSWCWSMRLIDEVYVINIIHSPLLLIPSLLFLCCVPTLMRIEDWIHDTRILLLRVGSFLANKATALCIIGIIEIQFLFFANHCNNRSRACMPSIYTFTFWWKCPWNIGMFIRTLLLVFYCLRYILRRRKVANSTCFDTFDLVTDLSLVLINAPVLVMRDRWLYDLSIWLICL